MKQLFDALKATFGSIAVGEGWVRISSTEPLPAEIQAMVDECDLYAQVSEGDRTNEPCTFIRKQRTTDEQVDAFNGEQQLCFQADVLLAL